MKPFIYQVHRSVLIVIAWALSMIPAKSQGLQVGDPILNLEVKRMLNYSADSARLTDFVGNKALLIDFWFTSCVSCLQSFPRIDSIQREFKDDLNVLLVTFEPKEKVLRTFSKIESIREIKLPSVVADTLLHVVFPHTSAPHEIWVGKDGKIKAITDHTAVNRKNVRSLIAGEELNLPVKKDNMEYSTFDPFMKYLELDKMLKYSVIASHQEGLPASDGMYIQPENGFLRAMGTNVHFQNLYLMAFNQWAKGFHYNRMVIDSTVLDRLEKIDSKKNTFCYDSWWRDTSRIKACSDMQSELDRFFNLASYSEKRKVPCLVLRQNGIKRRFVAVQGKAREGVYNERGSLILENVYLNPVIDNILNYGRYPWSPYQFIDETGFNGKVNIRLPKKFESIAQVNHFLKDYDLEVVMEKRWMDVIVIKEAKK